MANCPAQKLLNNRRHKSEISIKCPFVPTETTLTTTTTTTTAVTTPERRRRDTHRTEKNVPAKGVEVESTGHGKLKHGCTSLMYACQRGDTGSIIRELRNKVRGIKFGLEIFLNNSRNLSFVATIFIAGKPTPN